MPEAADELLVVEDDPEINQLLGAYAQICGFTYRSALNGNEAFRQLRKSKPALILLDLMLPDISGFDICRQVRDEEETRLVPIIMLTALDSAESRAKGLKCGASEYLTKPFDPDQLMQKIKHYRRDNNHA